MFLTSNCCFQLKYEHFINNIAFSFEKVVSSESGDKSAQIKYSLQEKKKKTVLKGIVHPKMKILSSFTHPQVVPNLYEFLCSAEHTKEDILKKVCNQAVLGHH